MCWLSDHESMPTDTNRPGRNTGAPRQKSIIPDTLLQKDSKVREISQRLPYLGSPEDRLGLDRIEFALQNINIQLNVL